MREITRRAFFVVALSGYLAINPLIGYAKTIIKHIIRKKVSPKTEWPKRVLSKKELEEFDIRQGIINKARGMFIPRHTRNVSEALKMYLEHYKITNMKVFITDEPKN